MELAKRMQEDIRLLDTSTIHADQHAPQKPQHPGSKFSNASSVQYPSFLATPPMQTQQYTYQHTAPMASPVPGVTTASYSEGELSTASVSRLIEMGFQRNDVTRELQKANGDERTALNALLGL